MLKSNEDIKSNKKLPEQTDVSDKWFNLYKYNDSFTRVIKRRRYEWTYTSD
jgi:hypothetical protein